MNRKVIIGSLTITLLCFGCEPVETPYGSETTNPNVQAYLGGPSEIRANFNDGLSTTGWPQYDEATIARVSSDVEYVINVDNDSVAMSNAGVSTGNQITNGSFLTRTSKQKDVNLIIQVFSDQIRIAWHRHNLGSCIMQDKVWHANLSLEKRNVPKPEMIILNIHVAVWKNGSQKCIGILITGNAGAELFCRVQCFNKPGKQEIRDTLTAALVAAGVATSVTAGWLANTAAPALEPLLAL